MAHSPMLTESERRLLTDNYELCRALHAGSRLPTSDEERHFVEVCRGRAAPGTELARVYRKMRSLLVLTGVDESALVLAGFVLPEQAGPVCVRPTSTRESLPQGRIHKEFQGRNGTTVRKKHVVARQRRRQVQEPGPAFTQEDVIRLLECSLGDQGITAARPLFPMFTSLQIEQVYDASESQRRTMLKAVVDEVGNESTGSWVRPFHDHRNPAQTTKMREQAMDPSNR